MMMGLLLTIAGKLICREFLHLIFHVYMIPSLFLAIWNTKRILAVIDVDVCVSVKFKH